MDLQVTTLVAGRPGKRLTVAPKETAKTSLDSAWLGSSWGRALISPVVPWTKDLWSLNGAFLKDGEKSWKFATSSKRVGRRFTGEGRHDLRVCWVPLRLSRCRPCWTNVGSQSLPVFWVSWQVFGCRAGVFSFNGNFYWCAMPLTL